MFALPERSVVDHFEAKMNGVIVKGEIHPKEEAQDKYEDAIASGKLRESTYLVCHTLYLYLL